MFDEQPDPEEDWTPVQFRDPNDFEERQAYPDPSGFYFPEEDS